MNNIKALLEQLGSLQITDKTSDETNEWMDIEMSGTPAEMNNIQAVIPKSMVLDPGWFDGNKTKFEDW